MRTGDEESRIATMLSSEPLLSDPRNHCVPILDLIQDDEDPTVSYMIMPFLRSFDSPPFDTVADVVDFTDQILEVRQSFLAVPRSNKDSKCLSGSGIHA